MGHKTQSESLQEDTVELTVFRKLLNLLGEADFEWPSDDCAPAALPKCETWADVRAWYNRHLQGDRCAACITVCGELLDEVFDCDPVAPEVEVVSKAGAETETEPVTAGGKLRRK